jgi:hypothetical protein
VVVSFLGLLGTIAFVRDEFLPPALESKFKLLAILPKWSWYWWVIIALIVMTVVIIEGSFQIVREVVDKLEAVGLERPLAFVTIGLDRVRQVVPGTFSIERISREFENAGGRQLRYWPRELEFQVGGVRVDFNLPPNTGGYIEGHRHRTYSGDLSTPLVVAQFSPLDITVRFRLEYDNVPAVHPRSTARTVRYTFTSFSPVVAHNVILEELET